jgi:hemerythrin
MASHWNVDLNLGIKDIDAQHKQFILFADEVYQAIKNNSFDQVKKSFGFLLSHTKIHFDTEEKYFKKLNYEGSKIHVYVHNEFIEYLKRLEYSLNKGIMITLKEADYIINWMIKHIYGIDRMYVNFFHENGL